MRVRPRNKIRDCRGAALVEFALIVPILILLFMGTFEATRVVRTMMKVSNAAQAYANLVASPQTGGLSSSDLTNFCTGAQLVMTPFDGTLFSAAVASLSSGDGVTWTQVWHDTTHCGSGVSTISGTSLASGITPTSTGDAVVVVRAQYSYTSPVVDILPGSQTLSDTAFSRPRANTAVTCSSCTAN
jgi:Flp pilus assembly protein TadG